MEFIKTYLKIIFYIYMTNYKINNNNIKRQKI